MSDDHVTLPVRIIDLSHLSNDELQSLRNKASILSREARRKANATIHRVEALNRFWMKSMSLKSNASPQERAEVLVPFERELLRHPEAYFAFAYANSLLTLDEMFRTEMTKRNVPGTGAPKKAKAFTTPTPTPPPLAVPPVPATARPPWELDDDA